MFDEQLDRIRHLTGKRTQVELAETLGIKQSSISDAKRRGKVPASWLIALMRFKNANPEWILTGNGTMFVSPLPQEPGRYTTMDEAAAKKADEEALRRLPSRMLAEELVRRIAISEAKAFRSNNE